MDKRLEFGGNGWYGKDSERVADHTPHSPRLVLELGVELRHDASPPETTPFLEALTNIKWRAGMFTKEHGMGIPASNLLAVFPSMGAIYEVDGNKVFVHFGHPQCSDHSLHPGWDQDVAQCLE